MASMTSRAFDSLPVGRAVLQQCVPAIVSQMIVLLYNWADAFFVGRLTDPSSLAAISLVAPYFLMLTALANLAGIGGGIVYSAALGKNDPDAARRASSAAVRIGVLIALANSMLFFFFREPLLSLTGARAETMGPALEYSRWIVVIGGPVIILNLVLANLVRAEGLSKPAAIGVSMGGLLNIVLDPLFVLPQCLGMGVAGAGLATTASNLCSVIFFIVVIATRKGTSLTLRGTDMAEVRPTVGQILSRGLPSCLQYMLTVVAVAALSHFLSMYGTHSIAAFTVVKELNYLPLYFSIGVSLGIMPMLSYNHAKGDFERRDSVFRIGIAISLGFSLLCLVCYELFAPGIARFFIDEPETDRYIAAFIRRIVVAMPFMAICYPSITLFQTTGHIKEALVCTMLRKGVLDIPLLILFNSLLPLLGCLWVQPVLDFISMIFVFIFLKKYFSL